MWIEEKIEPNLFVTARPMYIIEQGQQLKGRMDSQYQ